MHFLEDIKIQLSGALGDDPSSLSSMSGDLSQVEICDVCGKETEDFYIIDGLIVCESCKENFDLKENEDFSSNVCAICGWPINRPISRKEAKIFIKGVEDWLSKNSQEVLKKVEKSLKELEKENYLCRYDFFYLIKGMIEREDEKIASKFEEEICSKYDFLGSIVS